MTRADEATPQIPSLQLPNGGTMPSEGSPAGISAPAPQVAAPAAVAGRISSVSGSSTAAAPRLSAVSGSSKHCASTTGCGWPDEDLEDLSERMARDVEVKDRTKHLKKYSRCFTGRDAVRWLVHDARVAADATEAVAMGNAMMQLGLLHHVRYQHEFENRSHFYRFDHVEDHDDASSIEDSPRHSGWSSRFRPPNTGQGWKPGKEITRLQRRAADTAAEMQVLRATDGLLHEEQMRLQRLHRALNRRLDAIASTQDRSQFHTAVVALLQTAGLLLLVLLLYCGAAGGAGGGAAYHGHYSLGASHADGRIWLPALALLPALPLLFYLWEECRRRPGGRGRSAAMLAGGGADSSLRASLMADADSDCGSSNSGGSELSDEDVFFSDGGTCSERPSTRSLASVSEEDEGSVGPEVPQEDQFEGWPDDPGLLRLKPGLGQRLTDGGDPARIPLNTSRAIQFETDSFTGCAAVWVRDLPSAPQDLFAGKRRRSRISIQGRFKQRISMEDVITGQEFSRAANMPARWLVDQVLVKVARAINQSVEIGGMSAPSVLVPVAAMSQGMVVSQPGEEPDVTADIGEDCRLLGQHLTDRGGGPASADARKAYFADANHRRNTFFEPGLVYTFHIFQHLVNLGTYQLDVAVYKFDLAHYLDGQPMQFMMRPRGQPGRPHFAFEMWHRKLLPAARRAAQRG